MQRIDSNERLEESLQHRIRLLAYDLYTQRGKADEHALDDWLRAEDEILRGASKHWAWRHQAEKSPPK
jgi:Protein of unknown function (DUF2934)